MVIGGDQGTETTIKVEVLDMSSNTWEEVREMSTSRSALSNGVVTFNSLVEEVREGIWWQKEDEEKMDGVVDCGTYLWMETVSWNMESSLRVTCLILSIQTILMTMMSDIYDIEYEDTSDDSDEDMLVE